MIWVWLELNVLGVLPLVIGSGLSLRDSVSSIFYFLIQACGSFLLLISGLLLVFGPGNVFICDSLFALGLAVKLGLFPVHFWVVVVSRSISWWKIALILVIQKFAPVWLVFTLGRGFFLSWLGFFSALTGSLGIINSTGAKELFSFSSISNTGWLVISVLISSSAGLIFLICYFFVSLFAVITFGFLGLGGVFSSSDLSPWSSVSVWLVFLSLIGLPPFLGFAGKLFVLLPTVWSSVLILFCLAVSVLVASAGYLTASIGALFIALGAGSWLHGFRPTLVLVGLLALTLGASVIGALAFFLF
jgi:NADH:ubiquinone oxidoreductase subunit 2 (subunit N)